MDPAPVADRNSTPVDEQTSSAAPTSDASTGAQCPFPEAVADLLPVCPVPHGDATTDRAPVERSRGDQIVRRVLRISERPAHVSEAAANRSFQRSMMVSATRCTLTYVIFPFVLPLMGIARGVGPLLGLSIGTFAIICDVFAIRRFFAADHKYRWHFSAIALGIIGLLFVLLAEDLVALVT